MTQKILAGRAEDSAPTTSDLVRVKIDQVVLSRDPERPLAEALLAGARKFSVEVAVAYDTRCVTRAGDTTSPAGQRAYRDALGLGLLLARPGIGFPAAVHLERFGSPARLAVTD
jgi:aconitate hydratase